MFKCHKKIVTNAEIAYVWCDFFVFPFGWGLRPQKLGGCAPPNPKTGGAAPPQTCLPPRVWGLAALWAGSPVGWQICGLAGLQS